MDVVSMLTALGAWILSFLGIQDAPTGVQALVGFIGALILSGIGLKVLRWGLRR